MLSSCSSDSLISHVEISFQYWSSENSGTFPCFSSKGHFLSSWLPVLNNSLCWTQCVHLRRFCCYTAKGSIIRIRDVVQKSNFHISPSVHKTTCFISISQAPTHTAESTLISQAFLRSFSISASTDCGWSSCQTSLFWFVTKFVNKGCWRQGSWADIYKFTIHTAWTV